jgi:hypothetical protein
VGTRHALFPGVRPCPFCAGNNAVLFVACCFLSLLFVGVAVWVAVQRFFFEALSLMAELKQRNANVPGILIRFLHRK